MKFKIILSLLTLSIIIPAFGQTDCKSDVSTDPLFPTNNNLPYFIDNGTNVSSNDKYLNNFDWLQGNGPSYPQYSAINMMFNGTPYVMNNIMAYSIPEYEYISQEVAPLLKNGWELLLVNLGYYPNNIDEIPIGLNDNSALPYIVLYNKYSGIIRVFIAYGEDTDGIVGGNAFEITLGYVTSSLIPDVSGLFRLYGGGDRTLDKETEVDEMTSIVVKSAQGSHWASSDFQITYDPCTCFNLSKLKLTFKSITVSTVNLSGLAISQDSDLVDASGNLNSNVSDFLNGFERNTVPGSKEGMLIYKDIITAVDEYVKKYDNFKTQLNLVNKHNAKVNENLMLLKASKVIIAALNGNVLNAANAVLSNDNSLWVSVQSLNKGYTTLLADGSKLFDTKKVMKNVKKIFGESGETFIANNFEVQNKPSKPTMPSVTLTEMKFNGSITSATQVGGVDFHTPGVYGSQHLTPFGLGSHYSYPVYNEVLGVFALLESPKVIISEQIKVRENTFDYKERTNPITFSNEILTKRYKNWERNYQFKLSEELKYALNDVLDIKSYSINAAFNIKAKPVVNGFGNDDDGGFVNARQGSENVNVNALNSNVSTLGYPIISDHKSYKYYNTTTTDTNWFSFATVPEYSHNQDSSILYQTLNVPIDAFMPFTSGISLLNESILFKSYSSDEYDQNVHINNGVSPIIMVSNIYLK